MSRSVKVRPECGFLAEQGRAFGAAKSLAEQGKRTAEEQILTLLDELAECRRRVGYARGTLRTAIRLMELGGDQDVIKGSLWRALRVLETGKEEATLP